jgi:hypothetical protein
MSTASPAEIRLRDPLSETTRAERRNLLAISAIGIIIVKTGLVPSKISALGIDFSFTDQLLLFRALSAITGYFLVAFVVYAASDLAAWTHAIVSATRERMRAQQLEELESDMRQRDIRRAVEHELASRMGRAYSIFRFSVMSRIRALFDFLVPVVIGLWSVLATLTAHPPTSPKTQSPSQPTPTPNKTTMQPTAGRSDVSFYFMKTLPLQATLALASGG